MLIALPVAAVIVVLLKHARNNYERSRLYGLPSEFVLEVSNDQPVHFETQQLDIDLEEKNSRYRYI